MLPKAIKNITADELLKENEGLYNELVSVGQKKNSEEMTAVLAPLQTEVASLKASNLKLTNEIRIRQSAYKMNRVEEAEAMLAEGKSMEDILTSLIDLGPKTQTQEIAGTFLRTTPPAAGVASEGNADVDTKEKAIEKIMQTKQPKTRGEAIRLARQAYPNLFIAHILNAKGDK